MANKVLAGLAFIVLIFCVIGITALYRHRHHLFQVKSRMFILSILSVMTFFLLVHYTVGLRSKYAILFVLVQEFMKTGAFLYVILFYLRQAINYSLEEQGAKYTKRIKMTLLIFYILLFIMMVIWGIMHITNLIDKKPCRDWTWMVYRGATMVLVIAIIIIGIIVQKTVITKTKSMYYEDANLTVSHNSDKMREIPLHAEKQHSNSERNKYPLTSSLARRKEAIQSSLKNMWICFFMIIFVSTFDVIYVVFWRLNKSADD
jgi:hypothetical protein